MKLSSLIFLTVIFFVSCSNDQSEIKINSNKDSISIKEFYKNGTAKLMTKDEYDSYILKSNKRGEGKGFKLMPEIVSEIQSNDSTIYNVEFHVRTTNNKLIGQLLPDFNFKDLEGKIVKLSELKGKPIIINLWFVECPPCIAEMPTLNSIKEKYSTTDIQFLSMTYETKLKVQKFIKERRIDFRIISDIGKYSEILASNFPQTIFVNRQGIITDVQNGMIAIYDKKLKTKSDKMDETDFINSLNIIK
jgi:cytochrome c biogenesis protein CcmG, thiol:disulfide interchange protein DsbE